MDKTEAIRLLGGTVAAAASAVGITAQAVSDWPDPLPQRIADRVQAALWRRGVARIPDPTWPHPEGRPAIDVAAPQEARDAV